jgi:hypothetical protein
MSVVRGGRSGLGRDFIFNLEQNIAQLTSINVSVLNNSYIGPNFRGVNVNIAPQVKALAEAVI